MSGTGRRKFLVWNLFAAAAFVLRRLRLFSGGRRGGGRLPGREARFYRKVG